MTADPTTVHRLALPRFPDGRGTLTSIEHAALPFRPERTFFVTGVPVGTWRGGHAHRSTVQILIAVAGEVLVEVRQGGVAAEHLLVADGVGLVVPAGVWARQQYRTADAALLVLASARFDSTGYLDEAE